MTIHLYGGFGDKGGLCLGLRSGNFGALIDAGVHTGAGSDRHRYPSIEPAELRSYDTLILTHAHEDHVAALGWARERGFAGPVLATEETRADTLAIGRGYAEPRHQRWFAEAPFRIVEPGASFDLGPFAVSTGRSGHAVGGIWCLFAAEGQRVLYCGDVVPGSGILAMDGLPPCDVMLLDASYADDPSSMERQNGLILEWLAARPRGAVLPTPLSGRSLELLALIEGPLSIAGSMRAPLERQLERTRWLKPGSRAAAQALDRAEDWSAGDPLPPHPLLCDDGMGQSGPSRPAMEEAARAGHPVLLTGHLPRGSLGERLLADGAASWIRLPTHPTLDENLALVASCRPALILGHSCPPEGLERLAKHMPLLDAAARNGAVLSWPA